MELQATPSLSSLSKKEELQAKIKGQNHRATNPKKKKKSSSLLLSLPKKEERKARPSEVHSGSNEGSIANIEEESHYDN